MFSASLGSYFNGRMPGSDQAIVVRFRVIPLPLRVLRLRWDHISGRSTGLDQAIVVRSHDPRTSLHVLGFVGIIFQWQNAWFGSGDRGSIPRDPRISSCSPASLGSYFNGRMPGSDPGDRGSIPRDPRTSSSCSHFLFMFSGSPASWDHISMAECLVWIQAIVVRFRVIPALPLRVLRLRWDHISMAECLVRIQASWFDSA